MYSDVRIDYDRQHVVTLLIDIMSRSTVIHSKRSVEVSCG